MPSPDILAGGALLVGLLGLVGLVLWAPRKLALSTLLVALATIGVAVSGAMGLPGTAFYHPELMPLVGAGALALMFLGALISVGTTGSYVRKMRESQSLADARKREVQRLTGTNVRLEDELQQVKSRAVKKRDTKPKPKPIDQVALQAHQKALSAAEARAERYRDMYHRSVDAMCVLERESLRMAEVNKSMCALTGYDADELARMSFLDVMVTGQGHPGRLDLRRCTQEHRVLPIQIRRKDGDVAAGEITLTVVGGGDEARLYAVVRHAANRETLERELRDQAARLTERERKLHEANRQVAERTRRMEEMSLRVQQLQTAKDHFLSSVSHELRTPLTSIRSFSEILLKHGAADPNVRREFLEIINKESERLTRLVNNVLDLAKIESGKTELTLTDVEARSVVTDSVATMTGSAMDRNIHVHADVGPGLPMLHADRDKVQQLLTNLVGNAIKFSPDNGTIVVSAQVVPQTGRVEFSVRDEGPGIAPEDLDLVFEKFHQAHDPASGISVGTGLGLAICREIALMHHGRIWAESTMGHGSTFRVELPGADEAHALFQEHGLPVVSEVDMPFERPYVPAAAAARQPIYDSPPPEPEQYDMHSIPMSISGTAPMGHDMSMGQGTQDEFVDDADSWVDDGDGSQPGRRRSWTETGTLPPIGGGFG